MAPPYPTSSWHSQFRYLTQLLYTIMHIHLYTFVMLCLQSPTPAWGHLSPRRITSWMYFTGHYDSSVCGMLTANPLANLSPPHSPLPLSLHPLVRLHTHQNTIASLPLSLLPESYHSSTAEQHSSPPRHGKLCYTIQWCIIVQCTVYTVHYTLYTVQCTVYNVHCIMYITHTPLHSINSLTHVYIQTTSWRVLLFAFPSPYLDPRHPL